MQPFDLVIRGGTVATATDIMQADIGILGETFCPEASTAMPISSSLPPPA